MATRRKYKVQHFRDGGRVLEDVRIADDEPAEAGGFPSGILGDHPPSEGVATGGTQNAAAAESSTAAEEPNPLMHALHAQRRAEELQREAPQRPPPSSAIEQHIQKIPNLSEHKRAFLRQFPVLLEDPITQQIFNRHYVEALQSGGFTDDTAALDNHLIAATAREIEQRRQQLEPAHEPARTIEEEVQRLDDEIEANRRSEQPPAPIAPPPMRAAPRRSIPMSAPVSRDAPNYSGRREPPGWNTLTAEERQVARNSFSDPNVSNEQKEYLYLKNKQKLAKMRKDGSYSEQRD
jgi:hypothetical protein